ncbi:hypothetical protein Patl1_20479 [Pistacia atlantica]|uniref:Uncharacterized protein n=1 Tax=Pistacia atlantica TaxID=434234 RepID=A0ACC1BJ49_9ROSI|nr:hypothetical protein Patl1_20479 [Pistacia atlantica]
MESKDEANTTDWYELEAGESKATFLVWQDLTVIAQNLRNGATRKLLHGLNGYAEPDRIMAIMGPSGSGKSTLLDALPEDYFLGTLAVRETLTHSAQLRLPSEMTNNEIVEETIIKMGLQDCAENKNGNWHSREISKGEKRRLSISIEILTQPQVLFLDEVTSGLDSASAFFVLQVLRKIAHDGRIHQPSSHLFDLFDDLLLLSCGETIYFGDAKFVVKVMN